MQFTKNFSYDEFVRSATAKARGIDNTPGVDPSTCSGQAVIRNLQALCDTILQPIRDRYDKPIIVSSGYRCPKLNKAIGGATNSDHMYGCAADISGDPLCPIKGHLPHNGEKENTLSAKQRANKALFDLIVSMINSGEIEVKQLIDEKNYQWIHISYQDGRTSKRNQVLHL